MLIISSFNNCFILIYYIIYQLKLGYISLVTLILSCSVLIRLFLGEVGLHIYYEQMARQQSSQNEQLRDSFFQVIENKMSV